MPNTVDVRSDKEIAFEDSGIVGHFDEGMPDRVDAGDVLKRHDLVTQWYKWCDCNYPGTTSNDWAVMATAAGTDVDIRLLLRGHPLAGYAILIFLEACYAVDKALCGIDMEALAQGKAWHLPHEMRAYSYLLSDEMELWSQKELSELEKEIKSPFSNRVSLSWRVKDLKKCLAKLEAVMDGGGDGIETSIWATMYEDGTQPPAGLDHAIYDRFDQLQSSIEILSQALENSEQRDITSGTPPPVSHNFAESDGIRRRVPRATSPTTDDHQSLIRQTSTISEETIASSSDVASSVQTDSLLGARPSAPNLHHFSSKFWVALSRIQIFVMRCQTKGFLPWILHRETVFVLSIGLVVMSVYFMARSAVLANSQTSTSGENSLGSDSSFLGNLSQSILSYLSVYLIIAGTAHNVSAGLRYRSWLWTLISLSFISSTLGLSLYTTVPLVSVIFTWVAAFAQVVIPVLLVTAAGKFETRGEDDVELHRD